MRPLKLTNELINKLVDEFREQLETGGTHTDKINYSKNLADICKPEKDTPVEKVHVNFTADTYLQMMQLVNNCPEEIGWHGTVYRLSENEFLIDKILVFPQIVSGTDVTPDETEFNKWMLQFFEDDEDDTIQRMRFHGHSHVNMGTTPSGTDDRYQGDMLGNIKDYYIFMITNKRAEHNIMIYDVENNRYLAKEDITLGIKLADGTSLSNWATKEMEQVTKRIATPSYVYNAYNGTHVGEQQQIRETKIITRPETKQETVSKSQTGKETVYYDVVMKLWVMINHKGKKQFFTADPRTDKPLKKAGVKK